MQDHQPTSHPDAEAEAGKPLSATPPASEEVALQVPGFDPDALEEAAAQFRPSWDDVGEPERLSSDLIAAEFESHGAPPRADSFEPPFVVRGTGEIDVAPGEVIVPRPPRTPQLDYSGMRTHDGDDLGMALPKRSLKGLWITIAVFLGAATFAFAITRGMDDDKGDAVDRIEAAPIAPAALAAEESIKSTPPAPPPRVEAPAPTPTPAAQLTPEPAPPEPAPPELAPQEPPPVAAPVAVAKRPTPSAPVRARAEKSARPSRIKRATSEPRAPAPATHTSTPKKSKRGAGFVSTNPY